MTESTQSISPFRQRMILRVFQGQLDCEPSKAFTTKLYRVNVKVWMMERNKNV